MGDPVSALVDRAILDSDLGAVLAAREAGVLVEEHRARLRATDLLVLGALADRIRGEELGPEVIIYAAPRMPEDGTVLLPGPDGAPAGLDLLRAVAFARISAPPRTHVCVDWSACGLELAQVALGFGADQLVGRISNKRGLALSEGQRLGVGKLSQRELAEVVKRRELAGHLRAGGRVPVFIGPDGRPEHAPEASAAEQDAW